MAEENDTLKLTSVNYTSDNYLAAKKNEDGSYNVEDKVVFNENITTPGGDVATKADLDGKQDKLTAEASINLDGSTISVNTAPLVGDSDLPVTASAVNTKLDDYINDIQAADSSITVTKTGSRVTLKANGGGSDDIGGVVYYGYTNGGLNEGRLKQFLENVVAPSVNTDGFNIYLLIDGYGSNLIHYTNGAYDYSTFPSFPDIQASAKIVLDNEDTMSKKKVLENFSTFDFMAETIELIPAANIFYNNY